MEKISSLATEKLKTVTEAEDHRSLRSKRKAITALLPYAILRERDGQPEMFDLIICATRASRTAKFIWCPIDQFVSTLLSKANPRVILLASPHVHWHRLGDMGDFIRCWISVVSAVPYSEEIAQGVVDTLLQIASEDGLQYIPSDLWSWLTRRPSLPPTCAGRYYGTEGSVVKAVRALKDIEVLKSYLLLVWSEWDTLDSSGFYEMHTLIREDFGGIEMRHHRTDLIQRLDYVLGQLYHGLKYFKQHKPWFCKYHIQGKKNQYRELREMLLEMNNRTPFTDHAPQCTDSYPGYTQNLVRHSCAHSLPHAHSPTVGKLDTPMPYFVRTPASILSARFVTSPDTLLIHSG